MENRSRPADVMSALLQSRIDQMLVQKIIHYHSAIIQPTRPLSPTVRFHYDYTIPDMKHGRERAQAALI